MQKDMIKYVEECVICQKEKGNSTSVGLYQALPTPNRPCECIRIWISLLAYLELRLVWIVHLWLLMDLAR